MFSPCLKRTLLLALLPLSFIGCSSSSSKVKPAPLVELSAPLSIEKKWDASLGDTIQDKGVRLQPALDEDKHVFMAGVRGRVWAVNAENGETLWDTRLEKTTLSGGVGQGEGLVLVGTNDGAVIALDSKTGQQKWQVTLSTEILSPPQIHLQRVFARTIDGKLTALDSDSGKVLWVFERTAPLLTLRGTSTPVILDNAVIIGLDTGKLAALQPDTGKVLWETAISAARGRSELERIADIDADPIVAGDSVYVSAYNGRTVSVHLYSGRIEWERDIFSSAGIAQDRDAVYVVDPEDNVWALDRFSGATLWKQTKLQQRGISAPAVAGEYVVVGDKEGYVHWLRRSDGQFVSRYQVSGGAITVAPKVVDNLVLITTQRGELVAVKQP